MILETVNSQGFFASNFSEVINNGKECFVPPYCTYSRLIEEFKEIACARLCRNTREREREQFHRECRSHCSIFDNSH